MDFIEKKKECDCIGCRMVRHVDNLEKLGKVIDHVLLTRVEAHEMADKMGFPKDTQLRDGLFKNPGLIVHEETGKIIRFRVRQSDDTCNAGTKAA